MQYRDFGKKIEFKVSALGFSTMRLPIIGTESKNIDKDMAIRMIRMGKIRE